MQTVDLKQIMPLFDPVYDQQYFNLFLTLKERIISECFDAQTNRLCEKLLKDDPSNYNAWYAKKMCIFRMHPDLKKERVFTNSCLGEKAKSFQVWEHKRFLSELMEEYEEDLSLIEKVLIEKDTKNYHAWSYRVWLIEKIGRYEQELAFADKMATLDHYNNSAWAYRFFLVGKLLDLQKYQNEQVRNEFLSGQVEYALKSIKLYRENKASWNYLRGLFPSIQLKGIPSSNSITKPLLPSYKQYPNILTSCVAWWEEIKDKINQSNGKDESGLLFAVEREILTTLVHVYSHDEQNEQFAKNASLQLAQKDRQRVYYWQWVHKHL